MSLNHHKSPPPPSSLVVPRGAALVGRLIAKCFVVPSPPPQRRNNNRRRQRFYQGKVMSYDAERDLYHIFYAEDGDEEEMEWDELKDVLLPSMSEGGATTTASTNPQLGSTTPDDSMTTTKTRVVTPQSDDDRDTDSFMNVAEEQDDEEYDDEDDASFFSSDSALDKKPPAKRLYSAKKKKAPRQTTAYRIKKKKPRSHSKKQRQQQNRCSPKTTTTLCPPKKPNTTTTSTTAAPNSIAVRGLPQGSRAIAPGGFEIRTLDGIAPLLTVEVVQKAVQLVASGQYHAAARLLWNDHHHHEPNAIRAFVQAACRELGIAVPTSGMGHTTSKATSGGEAQGSFTCSGLSERAQARLKEGLQPIDADLPGRLLVVRTGTVLFHREDGSSSLDSDQNDDKEVEDVVYCVFASAAELHERIGIRVATYAMITSVDPPFGPWSVVRQRLETAGLWTSSFEDSTTAGKKQPFLVTIEWNGNGNDLPVGSWQMLLIEDMNNNPTSDASKQSLQWGLIEGATRDAPPVILGVSPSLIAAGPQGAQCRDTDDNLWGCDTENDGKVNSVVNIPVKTGNSNSLLPPLSREVAEVRLPASLLQKAIRRNFCSPAPLLEACRRLLCGGCDSDSGSENSEPPCGGVFEMLRTTWRCMLEDASPFDAPDDGSLLGLEELLLLSLIATADPYWKMPASLCRKAVAASIRTQRQCADFSNIEKTVDNAEETWKLQDTGSEERAVQVQNALLVMRAAIGGKFIHRSSLNKTNPIQADETALLDVFEKGEELSFDDSRLQQLDNECRLAAYDQHVAPAGLLLLQASLSKPPTSWKKHSLPALSRQVRKLITEANARLPDHHRLTRLAAWGRNSDTGVLTIVQQEIKRNEKQILSCREVVTSTGKLSEKEHEIIDCFEAAQRFRQRRKTYRNKSLDRGFDAQTSTVENSNGWKSRRAEVGVPPNEYDGRIAFLLAFAMAEEIEVFPEGGAAEVVNVLFCGSAKEPLLVQRIGKSRKEAAAATQGPSSGSSGAKAVPSLGYVQRSRSKGDRLLFEAAERAVAQSWRGCRTVALPLPPAGFQWNLTNARDGQEEQAEQAVRLTATLSDSGLWEFTIGGISVEPFDARNIISPCSLDTSNHRPIPLEDELEQILSLALYVRIENSPDAVLNALEKLHNWAVDARKDTPDEGQVYDWLPLATTGLITANVWRDVILALKTREKDDVVLGPVLADGTCKRDMTEGCLLRIFSALESLYPTALIKCAALKWRVRPRGAQYHHMLVCLEQLSRSTPAPVLVAAMAVSPMALPPSRKQWQEAETRNKRPVRRAAVACTKAMASLASSEVCANGDTSSPKTLELGPGVQHFREEVDDYVPVPKVTTKLWPHQEASVSKVVSGVKEGKRGHADASAVGAGKTLTALATIVRLAEHLEESGINRVGVLVMLPTKALVKEWLLQIAAHTLGFHVVEQREDGQLFSLTYGKSTPPPPIDGNTIVITTLDRVREHPFARQAAWDFVVIDECLAIQNATTKRCPSAWRQIEVSTLGVLMLSATFFRSKYADLFYMIRMLRTAFPRSMEWLSATIHEHIVCQVPETDRTWEMRGEAVPLHPDDLIKYRGIIEAYRRKQVNNLGGPHDFRRLFVDLEAFLRQQYEGRARKDAYSRTSVMAEGCFRVCDGLLKQGHRPLVFADTAHEAEHLLKVLYARGLDARMWASVARDNVSGRAAEPRQ